jgi:hypothetical protein
MLRIQKLFRFKKVQIFKISDFNKIFIFFEKKSNFEKLYKKKQKKMKTKKEKCQMWPS